MRKTEILAYTAGIVDGEGHITITRRSDTHTSRIQVTVTNTNEWLCQWLKMQFGGRVYSWDPHKSNWKRPYRWEIDYQKALHFLRLILPYLNLKRPQAEIAIAFQERHKRINRFDSDEPNVLQEADRILMVKLNKRGV